MFKIKSEEDLLNDTFIKILQTFDYDEIKRLANSLIEYVEDNE